MKDEDFSNKRHVKHVEERLCKGKTEDGSNCENVLKSGDAFCGECSHAVEQVEQKKRAETRKGLCVEYGKDSAGSPSTALRPVSGAHAGEGRRAGRKSINAGLQHTAGFLIVGAERIHGGSLTETESENADIRNRGVADGEEDIQDTNEEEGASVPRLAVPNTGANDSSVNQFFFGLLMCVQIFVVQLFLRFTEQTQNQLQNAQNESRQHLGDITDEFRKENYEQFRQIQNQNREQFQLIQQENREQLKQIQQENQEQFRQIQQGNREQFRQIQKDYREESRRSRQENCENLRLAQQINLEQRQIQDNNQQLLQQLQELLLKRDELADNLNSAEERISERVVEKLVNNEQFQRMVQSQHQHMQCTPLSPECMRCKLKCTCSRHLFDLNEQWKKEKTSDRANSRSWNRNVQLSQEGSKRDIGDSLEKASLLFPNNPRTHGTQGASGGHPSQSPNDDPSSSDDSDDKHRNKRNSGRANDNMKKSTQRLIRGSRNEIYIPHQQIPKSDAHGNGMKSSQEEKGSAQEQYTNLQTSALFDPPKRTGDGSRTYEEPALSNPKKNKNIHWYGKRKHTYRQETDKKNQLAKNGRVIQPEPLSRENLSYYTTKRGNVKMKDTSDQTEIAFSNLKDLKERVEGNARKQEQIVASGSGGPPSDPDSGSGSENEDSKHDQKRNKVCLGKDKNSDNKETDRNIPVSKIDLKERVGGKARKQEQIVASGSGGPPSDPDSGSGSENEDLKHDQKRNKICHSKEKNSDNKESDRNIPASKIDAAVWKRCIEKEDEGEALQDARRILKERVLPNQEVLDHASDVFKNSPEIVQEVCSDICSHIEKTSSNIIRVWASRDYRKNQDSVNRITFVVFTKSSNKIETHGYRCYQRRVNEISKRCAAENAHVRELEQACSKDNFETQKVKGCLNKNSELLMENHTNITKISISWFKSKGYDTEAQSVTNKTCIAVYVQVKGFIPLNETALQETIDGIDIDVRESVVMTYAGPNEHHENVKIGCAVHGRIKQADGRTLGGTLGGFFEADKLTYCISCAHVFLSVEALKALKNGKRYVDLEDGEYKAYQPVVDGSRAFGEVLRAIYKEGGNGESGVDAVIIKVTERFPLSGDFPDCPRRNRGFESPRSFSSGKICSREQLNGLIENKKLTVVKFGCASGWTRGCFRLERGSVRISNMVGPLQDFGMLLYNQFEIENIGTTSFAEYGDSGALVFTDENDELSAIGIIEGGDMDVAYVTPICDLFTALGLSDLDRLKDFTGNHNPMSANHSAGHIPAMQTPQLLRQITSSDSGNSSVGPSFPGSIEEKFEVLEQGVTQEFAKHAHDIKQWVKTSVDAKLTPVNSELLTVNSELRTTKSELKHEIDKSNTELNNVKTELIAVKSELCQLKNEIDTSKTELKSQMNDMQNNLTDSLRNMFSEFLRPTLDANTSNTSSS